MPRKGDLKAEKMSVRPPVRFTPSEMIAIRDKAKASDLPVATYIRTVTLARETPAKGIPGIDSAAIAAAISHGNAIGAELQRMVAALSRQTEVGQTPITAQVEYVLGRIIQVTEELMKALGYGR